MAKKSKTFGTRGGGGKRFPIGLPVASVAAETPPAAPNVTSEWWKQCRRGGVMILGTVCAVGAVCLAWCVVSSASGALGGALQGSIIVQSMFGTSIAGSMMAVTASLVKHVKAWVVGVLSTTVVVSGQQGGLLYDALKRSMTQGSGMLQMPVATAFLAQQETLTALQRFAMMRQALRRRCGLDSTDVVVHDGDQGSAAGLVQYCTTPAYLPLTRHFQGHVLLLTLDETSADITIRVAGRQRHDLVRAFLQQVLDEAGAGGGFRRAPGSAPVSPGVYMPVVHDDTKGKTRMQWQQVRELRPRDRNTLFLPDLLLEQLLADAETFFLSADEYEKRQQPFRRGWMLHGPPGTGKSTVPVVVATELGLPLCVLEVGSPNLTDAVVRDLLNTAPVPSLVVLEDVDAAHSATHRRGVGGVGGGGLAAIVGGMPGFGSAGPVCGVTLAGLLNALDGLGAHEGHLVIMTTNNLQRLDPALVRPGRCDVQANVPLATRSQVAAMLRHEFPEATKEDVDQFLVVVRPGRFSPAAISEYLMRVKGDLAAAISEDSLATLRSTELAEGDGNSAAAGVHQLLPELFKALWQQGAEVLFPWGLAAGVLDIRNMVSTHMLTLDPWLQLQPGSVMAETEDDLAQLFLSFFPRARVEAAQFGAVVMEWSRRNELPLGMARARTHLRAHCHSAAVALASVHEWLLTFRRAGANLLPVLSIRFVLYFYGAAGSMTPARFEGLVAELAAAGIKDGSQLLDVPRDIMSPKSCGVDDEEYASMQVAHETLCRVRTEVIGGRDAFRDIKAMRRTGLACQLVNAYEDQGVTFESAMRALGPPLTTLDGRSGFSGKVVFKLTTACQTMEACLAAMAAAQDQYDFPAVFRGPAA